MKSNNQIEISSFASQVYQATAMIPAGKVSTYGAIARFLGKPKAARAVGGALHTNPFAPKVPCHRVVKSDGSLGGFAGGSKNKIALLRKEGVICKNNHLVDWADIFFNYE